MHAPIAKNVHHVKNQMSNPITFAKNQIDVAGNMNIYKSNQFAPSFGKHSKTSS